MAARLDPDVHVSAASDGKAPRTARGERILRKILDAARHEFRGEHRDIDRIIDESEFVDPTDYREHYETTARRITARLVTGREKGQISQAFIDDELAIIAWGMMGANVFLGLRFFVWRDGDASRIAEAMVRVWREGLSK